MNGRVVSDGIKKKLEHGNKKVLFEHKSGWVIVFDGSLNYCVFNVKELSLSGQNRWKKGHFPDKGTFYYGKIEDAVCEVYRKLIDYYKCGNVSLLSSIKKAKSEIFEVLNDVRSLVELEV